MKIIAKSIALMVVDKKNLGRANCLAFRSNLPLIDSPEDAGNYRFIMAVTDDRIELHNNLDTKVKPIVVDFLSTELVRRIRFLNKKNELIARAIGLGSSKRSLKVLDATAGFGIDAYVLASFGCQVTMVERSVVIGILLEDGLGRLRNKNSALAEKMNLIHLDAFDYFRTIETENIVQRPDVIYLDPLYPKSKKSSLNRKSMRILREIVGEDFDADKLLKPALAIAHRVVVKRHKKSEYMANLEPSLQFFSNGSSRYDVYY